MAKLITLLGVRPGRSHIVGLLDDSSSILVLRDGRGRVPVGCQGNALMLLVASRLLVVEIAAESGGDASEDDPFQPSRQPSWLMQLVSADQYGGGIVPGVIAAARQE